MKKTQKNLLAVAAVICLVLGTIIVFPAFQKEIYWLVSVCVLLVIGGIILLAISFGD